MSPYKTITGRRIDLSALSSQEKEILAQLLDEHGQNPDWDKYSNFWQSLLRPVLVKIRASERTRHPLYKVAQDLEMRLGVAQGAVAEPDYRDYLVDRIEEKYGSRYRFCKETGIPEAFLSQVLSGKKDFSIETLRRAATALGLGLALLPTSDVAELPMSDFSALRQVCAVVSAELASLGSLEDHLKRIKDPAKRGIALSKESSMFDGALEEVLREVEKQPEEDRGDKVFDIINRKKSELETLLGFLRARLAVLADEQTATEERRERSLPML